MERLTDWEAALDATNATLRVRWLCSDGNPNAVQRDKYRSLMIRRTEGATSQVGLGASPGRQVSPCCGGNAYPDYLVDE